MLDDIRFWFQVMTDSERTIVCSPEHESRLKTVIEAWGLSKLLTVLPRRECPDDQMWVVDEHAADASLAQALTREPVPLVDFASRAEQWRVHRRWVAESRVARVVPPHPPDLV